MAFFVWWSYRNPNQHTFLISSELLLSEFGIKKRSLLVNLILGVLPTPLHAAAVNGNKPLLQRLLHEGNAKLTPTIFINLKNIDWYLVNTQLTLNQCLDQHLIETWSTVGQWLAECWLTYMCQSTFYGMSARLSWHSTDCWQKCRSSVDWVSTEVSIGCLSSVSWMLIDGQSRILMKGINQHSTADVFSTISLSKQTAWECWSYFQWLNCQCSYFHLTNRDEKDLWYEVLFSTGWIKGNRWNMLSLIHTGTWG